jgi:Cys-rich protein (TIGR01571 family)
MGYIFARLLLVLVVTGSMGETAQIVGTFLTDFVNTPFFCLTLLILVKVRIQVREKYGIPARENEDCCCSLFCPCFVAAQMLRHTTDYDTYPSTCCTETGIPPHAPSIV